MADHKIGRVRHIVAAAPLLALPLGVGFGVQARGYDNSASSLRTDATVGVEGTANLKATAEANLGAAITDVLNATNQGKTIDAATLAKAITTAAQELNSQQDAAVNAQEVRAGKLQQEANRDNSAGTRDNYLATLFVGLGLGELARLKTKASGKFASRFKKETKEEKQDPDHGNDGDLKTTEQSAKEETKPLHARSGNSVGNSR